MSNLLQDTDEELIEMAKKFGFEDTDFEEIIAHYSKELRALINHYIAKDRAQGQEPVGVYHVHAQGSCIGMVGDTKLPIGDYPVYTHAQPIAEIQAEALEKAAKYYQDLQNYADHELSLPEITADLFGMADKLRKGEPNQ